MTSNNSNLIKVFIQTFFNTLASMVLLSWLHWHLVELLLPQDSASSLLSIAEMFAQLIIFTILILPLGWIAYLCVYILHRFNKIQLNWTTHIISASIVIISLLIILRTPQLNGLYVIYVFYSLQMIAKEFYYLAIAYAAVQLFINIHKRRNP